MNILPAICKAVVESTKGAPIHHVAKAAYELQQREEFMSGVQFRHNDRLYEPYLDGEYVEWKEVKQ